MVVHPSASDLSSEVLASINFVPCNRTHDVVFMPLLTALKVRNPTNPGRYSDTHGLYFVISKRGSRS